MRSPPKPVRRTVGSRRVRSRIRLAPCRSPLGSPALTKACILAGSGFGDRASRRTGLGQRHSARRTRGVRRALAAAWASAAGGTGASAGVVFWVIAGKLVVTTAGVGSARGVELRPGRFDPDDTDGRDRTTPSFIRF